MTAPTTDTETIRDSVVRACVDILAVDASEVTGTTHFADDLGADSLALVEVVMELEEAFSLRIPEEELGEVATVDDAVAVVARYLAKTP